MPRNSKVLGAAPGPPATPVPPKGEFLVKPSRSKANTGRPPKIAAMSRVEVGRKRGRIFLRGKGVILKHQAEA